jgi:hypothetical protein
MAMIASHLRSVITGVLEPLPGNPHIVPLLEFFVQKQWPEWTRSARQHIQREVLPVPSLAFCEPAPKVLRDVFVHSDGRGFRQRIFRARPERVNRPS